MTAVHDSDTVAVRHEGPIAFLTLNRPSRLNALSFEMLVTIRHAAEAIAASDARTVVVHGAGSSFSAGIDLETLQTGLIEQADPELRYDAAKLGGDVATSLAAMPQATVAALHGSVVGGGLVLAAACDLRVADASTYFSIPEIDLGIPLGWGGIPTLVSELGAMRTKDLVMTGRSFSANDAFDYGFLTAVVGDGTSLDVATQLASAIASKARFPITMTKRHVNEVVAGDESRDDSIGMVAAIEDPEAAAQRDRYLESFDR